MTAPGSTGAEANRQGKARNMACTTRVNEVRMTIANPIHVRARGTLTTAVAAGLLIALAAPGCGEETPVSDGGRDAGDAGTGPDQGRDAPPLFPDRTVADGGTDAP